VTGRPKYRKPCVQCGATVESRSPEPTCGLCDPRRSYCSPFVNRVAGFCELCGRHHSERWQCAQRAERAAEDVRLWLYEGQEP